MREQNSKVSFAPPSVDEKMSNQFWKPGSTRLRTEAVHLWARSVFATLSDAIIFFFPSP